MHDTILSVTDAARRFADCVNRARYQSQSFLLVKNGIPVARLGPVGRARCSGRELAGMIADLTLSDADATAWRDDLRAGRKLLKPPRDR